VHCCSYDPFDEIDSLGSGWKLPTAGGDHNNHPYAVHSHMRGEDHSEVNFKGVAIGPTVIVTYAYHMLAQCHHHHEMLSRCE
jgi:hypothetical protein